MYFKRNLALVLCSFIAGFAMAVPHQIKINLNGLSNKKVLLAHYYANNTKYVEDTAFVNGQGFGVFNNSRNLEQGIYLIILPDYKNFEFLIGANQEFEIEAAVSPSPHNIKFINSPENADYYIFKQKLALIDSTETNPGIKSPGLKGKKKLKKKELEENRKGFDEYKKQIILKYKNSFLSLLVSSKLMEKNTKKDTMDIRIFKTPGLLNTPYFEGKLFYYVDVYISQNPDTVKHNLTVIFNNALTSNYVFRYISAALLAHYHDKKDAEEIYLYVADNYYIPFVSWDSPEKMATLQNEVEKIKLYMVGSDAPNIYLNKYSLSPGMKSLNDTSFVKTTLYRINAEYLIVAFWDESCDSCRKDILVLFDIAKKFKNKGVVLLSMNTRMGKGAVMSWIDFINKKNLFDCVNASAFSLSFKEIYNINAPEIIYMLDKNKKIIARKIGSNQVENYIPLE